MDLMGFVEYSKHRGCHLKSVQRAIEAGRIGVTMRNGRAMIDPIKADEQWAKNTDISRIPKKSVVPNENIPSFADSRAIEKAYMARIARLNYEEKKKKLIDSGDVERRIFELARRSRNSLLVMPSRIAHELANMTDPNKIQIFLEKEMTASLEEFTNGSKTITKS